MPATFRVRDHLTVAIVREFNRAEWQQGPAYYFGPAKTWWRPDAEVIRILDHPTYDVQELLDAVPAYPTTLDGLRQAWAHHMALHACCHPWANANHRTANLSFNYALDKAECKQVGFLEPVWGSRLVQESHLQRDRDGGEYALSELADEGHPYRQLFLRFSEQLAIVDAKESSRLMRFGPG